MNIFFTFRKKPGALKPTVNDIDSALSWMVSKDIRRKLPGSFDDAKAWFQTLHKVIDKQQLIVDVKIIRVRIIMIRTIFFPLVLPGQRNDGTFSS